MPCGRASSTSRDRDHNRLKARPQPPRTGAVLLSEAGPFRLVSVSVLSRQRIMPAYASPASLPVDAKHLRCVEQGYPASPINRLNCTTRARDLHGMQHRGWGLTRLLALLLTLDRAHMYVFSPLGSMRSRTGAAVVQHQQIPASPRVRRGRTMHMSAATPEPDEEAELASPGESAAEPDEWRSALSARISEVRASEAEAEELSKQLAHVKHAFVLVFDVDTEEEAVYIMDVEEQRGVVLAFETKYDAP